MCDTGMEMREVQFEPLAEPLTEPALQPAPPVERVREEHDERAPQRV